MPIQSQVLDHPRRAEIDAAILAGRSLNGISGEFGLSLSTIRRYAHRPPGPARPAKNTRHAPDSRAVAASDPVRAFRESSGMDPTPYQQRLLVEKRHTVVLKGRQTGFTQAAAALAIDCARSRPGALAAVISPSLRQSTEISTRARLGLLDMSERLVQDSVSLLRLKNGSRILSLPGSDRGVRGYPADLLVIDEAAFVADRTWVSARPMVAATGGRIVVQSTPGAPVGFFWELATAPPKDWAFAKVRSDEAPFIDPEFLEKERESMSASLFAQEYLAEFSVSSIVGALWAESDWTALVRPEEET